MSATGFYTDSSSGATNPLKNGKSRAEAKAQKPSSKEDVLNAAKKERTNLKRKLAEIELKLRNKTSAKASATLTDEFNQLNQEIRDLDKVIRGLEMDECSNEFRFARKTLRWSRFASVARLAKLAKAAGLVGTVAGILVWKERAAEAGVARATAEAVPVLGDLLVISEDTAEILQGAKDTEDAYRAAEAGDKLYFRNLHRLAAAELRKAFEKHAATIRIYDPHLIDLEAADDALREFYNTAYTLTLLRSEGRITDAEFECKMGRASAILLQSLQEAANQPDPSASEEETHAAQPLGPVG